MKGTFVGFLFCLALFKTSSAITCYSCQYQVVDGVATDDGSNCADNPSSDTTVDCDDGYCLFADLTFDIQGSEYQFQQRTCLDEASVEGLGIDSAVCVDTFEDGDAFTLFVGNLFSSGDVSDLTGEACVCDSDDLCEGDGSGDDDDDDSFAEKIVPSLLLVAASFLAAITNY